MQRYNGNRKAIKTLSLCCKLLTLLAATVNGSLPTGSHPSPSHSYNYVHCVPSGTAKPPSHQWLACNYSNTPSCHNTLLLGAMLNNKREEGTGVVTLLYYKSRKHDLKSFNHISIENHAVLFKRRLLAKDSWDRLQQGFLSGGLQLRGQLPFFSFFPQNFFFFKCIYLERNCWGIWSFIIVTVYEHHNCAITF